MNKKELKIEYCPTEQMLADFFTKALTGRLFWHFRDVLLGYKPISVLYDIQRFSVKERVVNPSLKESTIVTGKSSDDRKDEQRTVT